MSLPETYKAIIIKEKPENYKLEDIPLVKPGKNQVLARVEFTPINPTDILAIFRGDKFASKPGDLVGYEASGVIVAVGEDLKVPHKVGDKVHLATPTRATYAQYILVASEYASPIKNGLSLEEAASHYVNPMTVHYMGAAAKRQGAKAVIHTAGSSALGRMIIRYFKHLGIKTINIVRRDDFTEELLKDGADYVLNSKDVDFEAKLKDIAHKEKATITFEAVGGELTAKILKNQPEESTCYLYGDLSGGEGIKGFEVADFLFSRKVLTGLTVIHYMQEITESGNLGKVFEEVNSLLPTVFKSNIYEVYSLAELDKALASYDKNSSKGKILLRPN